MDSSPPPSAAAAPLPILAETTVAATVAPGVVRREYRMQTADGVLRVHVVAVDPGAPGVRIDVCTANDRLVSDGETVSSMAARAGAVAGINADYFDIGKTNQPLNVVVEHGVLERSPSQRIAFVVGTDGTVAFRRMSFTGTVTYGTGSIPLTGVNVWPPDGGASLITPAYGVPAPEPGVVALGIGPHAGDPAVFTVLGLPALGSGAPPAVPLLALGPAALALAAPPPPGTAVRVSTTLDPALATVAAAAGGGPLLLADGRAVTDPFSPAPQETNVRYPVAGAGLTPDRHLLLVAVDGRSDSVGLTRSQFAQLFARLGATDAMAFDSGGSATLVARTAGEPDDRPRVVNTPSDGAERPVADAILVSSDAPPSAGERSVRPAGATALAGAALAVACVTSDGASRTTAVQPLGTVIAATVPGVHRVSEPGCGDLTYTTIPALARLTVDPPRPNPDPGETVALRARGYAADGTPVLLGDVAWSATGGTLGALAAPPAVMSPDLLTPPTESDAAFGAAVRFGPTAPEGSVTVRAGGMSRTVAIAVGRRDVALPFFAPAMALAWRFASEPRGAPGVVTLATAPAGADPDAPISGGDVLTLPYDLNAERAAYAQTDLPLPAGAREISLDAFGDGSGVALRAAFTDPSARREAVTLAPSVDWTGWRSVRAVLPADLAPPLHLTALYVVRLGHPPRTNAGTMHLRHLAVAVAGGRP